MTGISAARPPAVLRAAGPESRFGFSLSSAGDVNADGFQVFEPLPKLIEYQIVATDFVMPQFYHILKKIITHGPIRPRGKVGGGGVGHVFSNNGRY